MDKVIILGNGLMGTEIHNQTNWKIISRKHHKFNISSPQTYKILDAEYLSEGSTIINCIAFTDTYSNNSKKHWEVNVKGTNYLIEYCNNNNLKLVHISTDFLYAGCTKNLPTELDPPVPAENWYSYTKLLGDGIVQLLSNNYLICRCGHKEINPFPFKTAFTNRIGNFDSTEEICKLIITLINKNQNGVFNLGTEIKSIYNLVKPNNPNIIPSKVPIGYPRDVSMDISKLKKILYNE